MIAASWGRSNVDNASVVLFDAEGYAGDELLAWAKNQFADGEPDRAAAAIESRDAWRELIARIPEDADKLLLYIRALAMVQSASITRALKRPEKRNG
jgi:hypothetical protein